MIPITSRLLGLALVLAPLSLAGVRAAGSGERSDVVDRGTFTLNLNGVRIGEERFIIRSEPAGAAGPIFRARGELNLKLDGRTMRIRVALEAAGSRALPRRYAADINGAESTTILGTLVRDRLRLDVRSPRGQEMKQFLVRGNAVILDRHIAHHYFFASLVLADDESVEASVIVPRDRAQHAVVIEDHGEEPVRFGEQELQLRHLSITTQAGSVHHLWLDGDRLIKVDVPADGFTAQRLDAVHTLAEQLGGK